MATALKLKNDIKRLKAAMKSKATPKSFIPKLEAQLKKAENELESVKSGGKPRKKSTSQGTSTTLSALQKLIQKNKYAVYRGSKVDLKKDAEEGAFPTGKRISKGLKANQFGSAKENKGNVYYEKRANRIDVKQPKKKQRYPKLEEGGMMADGGLVVKSDEDLREVAKYMAKAVKKKWDFKDLVYYFEQENNYDYKYRVKIWDEMNVWEMKKTEENIYKVLKAIVEANEKGGMMAKGGELSREERKNKTYYHLIWDDGIKVNDEYFESNKEASEKFYKLSTSGKIVAAHLDKDSYNQYGWIENHKNVARYPRSMASGGMMAKGGAISHGLKVGDKIWADQFWENSVIVDNPKTGRAVVYLETGERKEQGKMAHGGELHRLEEKNYANGGRFDTERYPELRKIADKISDETAEKINEEVKDVKSEMPYKAQWVLEEVVRDLENRI